MIEINLRPQELASKENKDKKDLKSFIYLVPFVFVLIICVHIYLGVVSIVKNYQLASLNSQWKSLEPKRKTLDSLKNENQSLSTDTQIVEEWIKQRMNCSEKINRLSQDLPSGVWFNELILSVKDLTIRCSAVSLQKEEMTLINKFISNLKEDALFLKDVSGIDLGSVQRRTVGSYDVVDFVLVANLK